MGRSSRAVACRNLRIIGTSRFTEYRDINLYLPQRQPKGPASGRAGTGVIGGRQAAEGRVAERRQFGGRAFPGWEGMEWVGGAGPGGPGRTGASALLVQERSQFEREGLRVQGLGWAERGAFGLEFHQFLTGKEAGALDVTLAALEAEERHGAIIPGAAEFAAGHGRGVTFQAVFPVLGVDALHAAELPVIADEDVDVELFLGGGGLTLLVVEVGEALEIGGIFTADDVGLRR